MKLTRHIFVALFILCGVVPCGAQKRVEGEMSVDIVSQYIWRGQDLGHVSIQPGLGISWRGLSLSAWGNVGLTSTKDTRELDLTLSYTTHGFNIGLTDYWFSKGSDAQGRYFAYATPNTNHIFEANVGYDFGFLSLQWYTNFAGDDFLANGKQSYSSYFEASAPFRFITCDWEATLGISPYSSVLYGNENFAVTNISLKAAKVFDVRQKVSIPVYLALTVNPCASAAYFVAGFAIQPNLHRPAKK